MLRAIFLVICGLAALAPPAAAGTVGVVVTGEASLQPPLASQLESWLRSHGHEVVALALDTTQTRDLIDCLAVQDDSTCARKVVETNARSESIVYARAVREGSTINLTVNWILKGRPMIGGRRGCEPCSVDALRGAADELLTSLAPSTYMSTGRLKLRSKPDGMIVMLDGVKIGVTPLERDIAAGVHKITLVSGGTQVGAREVAITAGDNIEVTIPVVYPEGGGERPPEEPSRVPPVLCWIVGAGAIAGGAVALYYGAKGGPDEKYVYPGATPAGVALVSAGAVTVGVGIWLWVRGSRASRESAPVAAIGPGGGYLGWQGRF